ncbi:MAG: hypothetical protein KME13_18425 [Myxacorys californica WJT36-NPBG1]|jgi:hypothetical protein|nr:hypothetical protein [Myxacorys californica WJT36-NPBG1]
MYLAPGAEFALRGNELSGLTWMDERPIPTLAELEAAQVELNKVIIKDWNLLVQKLLGCQLYMKSFYLSKDSLAIAQSFNKLEQVVLITRIEDALAFFMDDLLEELKDYITPEEMDEVNQILKECGFNNIVLQLKAASAMRASSGA